MHIDVDRTYDDTVDLEVTGCACVEGDGGRLTGESGDPGVEVPCYRESVGFNIILVYDRYLDLISLMGADHRPVLGRRTMTSAVVVSRLALDDGEGVRVRRAGNSAHGSGLLRWSEGVLSDEVKRSPGDDERGQHDDQAELLHFERRRGTVIIGFPITRKVRGDFRPGPSTLK